MKLGQLAIALSTLIASTLGLAGTLTSSSNVTFLAFDGQKVKKNTKLDVSVSQPHQVVVEVSSIYRAGGDEAFFESSPIVVRFQGSQENIIIKAPKLSYESEVNKFKSSPKLTVETLSGNPIEFKLDYLKGEGFLPNANLLDNLSAYNSSNGVASLKSLATVTASMPMGAEAGAKASKAKVMVQGENIAEQQLQYWFQQADKETQKRFLDWAKKQ